jgi:hypothetical protein
MNEYKLLELPYCVICLSEELRSLTVLKCGHVFHENCRKEAMKSDERCPTCRKHCDTFINLIFEIREKPVNENFLENFEKLESTHFFQQLAWKELISNLKLQFLKMLKERNNLKLKSETLQKRENESKLELNNSIKDFKKQNVFLNILIINPPL